MRIDPYLRLMRLDRPIGIWLVLWPVGWALWMASGGVPPLDVLLIFIAGTVVMRSAGCVINDFADRDFDPHVKRTALRPIAAGEVPARHALWLFTGLCLLALLLVLQTNALTIALSVPAVLLAASYPFAKRYHHLPQAHLGLAFAWAIPMAFAAVPGVPDWRLCWLLMAATIVWAMIYDTFYAMSDRDEDRRIGVRSSAILFGRADRVVTGGLQLMMLAILAVVGARAGLGAGYAVALAGGGMLMLRQQWLIRRRDPGACLKAFLESHWLGLLILAGIMLDYARMAA